MAKLTNLKLAARVSSLVMHLAEFSSQWAVHLYDPTCDNQSELRNKIFPVYVYGLFDSLVDIDGKFNNLIKTAQNNNNIAAIEYLRQFKMIFESLIDLLSVFSEKEVIFLRWIRNLKVHSYDIDSTRKYYRINVIKGNKCIKQEVSRECVDSVLDEFSIFGSIDNIITKLRHKFMSHKTLFWIATIPLNTLRLRKIMHEDILNINTYKTPRIIYHTGYKSYFEFKKHHPERLFNLYEVRERGKIITSPTNDPLFSKKNNNE